MCLKVFDQNKDGFVVAEEIKFVMKQLGQPMTDEEVDEILRQGDVNGDGKLNYSGVLSFLYFLLWLRLSNIYCCIIRTIVR